jgi:hypothetical protein
LIFALTWQEYGSFYFYSEKEFSKTGFITEQELQQAITADINQPFDRD